MENTRDSSATPSSTPRVQWDESRMNSSYANVVNATGTREEIMLLFGVHQAWQRGAKEVVVQLTNRIILNPLAAKRLQAVLTQVLREHENRFGPLQLDSSTDAASQPLKMVDDR